jgi:signal transduction histidine kinase
VDSTAAASWHLGAPRLALPALAVAFAVATVMIAFRSGPAATTYAMASGGAAAADLGAGLGLLAAGVVTAVVRPAGSVAALAILAGAVWLGADWVGWEGGWDVARGLGAAAAPLLLPLLLHLSLVFPSGRLPSRAAVLAIGAVYAVGAAFAVTRALFYDPFLDPDCWSNCSPSPLAVAADQPLAETLWNVWLGVAIALGLALAAISVRRLLAATRVGRRALWAVLVPLAGAGCAAAAYAIALLSKPLEDPSDSTFLAIYVAGGIALTCLAAGLAWSLIDTWRTRDAVGRLAADLGAAPAPGSLQAALARSLGDDQLEVAYWLPRERRYVNSAGAPVEPLPPGAGRAATAITRGGEPLALVLHDRVLHHGEALEREIGSAARLAVDNERLRAQVLAQLADLRAARSRIVATGDAERTRLERDLHDGAQQRLLALSYDIRTAVAIAEEEGDPDRVELLSHAINEVSTALADLRELADGIYPAILGEAGLAPALETYADSSPLALEILEAPSERRFGPPVENAAYLVVTEAAALAAKRGADWMAVRLAEQNGSLMLAVEAEKIEGEPALPPHIVDRVGALGGRIERRAAGLEVEIPCV